MTGWSIYKEDDILNYGAIKPCDIADGPGVRVSLFVSGCRHRCEGCFQPETWDFSYGQPYTDNTQEKILDLLKPDYIAGLTILGGEPLEPENMTDVLNLICAVRELFSDKTVWLYTGSTLEELIQRTGVEDHLTRGILAVTDILVDGPFIQEEKDIGLAFRGSDNQRIIDLAKTRETGQIVLWTH